MATLMSRYGNPHSEEIATNNTHARCDIASIKPAPLGCASTRHRAWVAWTAMPLSWADRTLENEDLGETDLVEAELRNCRFDRCRFRGGRLTEARVFSCVFQECDFRGAHLDLEQAVYLARCHGARLD